MNVYMLVKEWRMEVEIQIEYFMAIEGKCDHVNIMDVKEIKCGIWKLGATGEKNEIWKKAKEVKEKTNVSIKEDGFLIEDLIISISWSFFIIVVSGKTSIR